MARTATTARKTNETEISVSVLIDGRGIADISTGVGFFDHLLTALSRHSMIDVRLRCVGDTQIDDHHTVEDCGIALGTALNEALGDRTGIRRFGSATVPLDEALSRATVDLGGRGYFELHGEIEKVKIGTFDAELVEDFFQALAMNAKLALHIERLAGRNLHHIVESMSKATARALRDAVEIDPRCVGAPSTKGTLV